MLKLLAMKINMHNMVSEEGQPKSFYCEYLKKLVCGLEKERVC